MKVNFEYRNITVPIWAIIFILSSLILPARMVPAQDVVPLDADVTDPQAPESSLSETSILQYQDQITERENAYGPYDPQLGEQLLGQGLLYKTQGNYEDAAEALQRSLNIKRINEGIQNTTQVPVLNALIEVYTATKNWDELDRNYHLLLWVLKRNLKSGNPALLPFIESVGQWKLIAYSNGLLSEPPQRTLSNMIDVFQSTIDIMEELYGKNDPRLISTLNGLATARYQLVHFVNNTPVSDFQGHGQKTMLQRVCTLVMTTEGLRTVCYMQETPNPDYYIGKQISKDSMVRTHMISVRETLDRVVDINTSNQSNDVRDRALALVNLGDWYFLNGKRNTAIQNYRQAYQLLDGNGQEQETIESLFGNPVPLPSMIKNPYINNENVQSTGGKYVKLAFDVTASGKPRKIKVIEEGGSDNLVMRKLARRYVKASLFRPRIEDGKPVDTRQMVVQLSGPILERGSYQAEDDPAGMTGTRIRR